MEIKISGLNKVYPTGKAALQNVELCFSSPGMVGLLGPNGAGKTTLMKLLTASILPTSGEILLNTKPLGRCEGELKRSLGYLPQNFGLYEELSVFEFLDYMSAIKGIAKPKEEIERVISLVNLTEQRKQKIKSLSGGQRQRVGIAQALLGSPKLIILDEPTVGLDPEERIRFRNLFAFIAKESLVLLSTHIIEDVQSVCSSLVVMNRGTVLFSGTPQNLIKQARNHVGVTMQQPESCDCRIISQQSGEQGEIYRVVAQTLPDFVKREEPTLEDAYVWLMKQEEEQI